MTQAELGAGYCSSSGWKALKSQSWCQQVAAQRAGNGSTGWKEPLIVTILLLSCSGVQGESWRSQPPAVGLLFFPAWSSRNSAPSKGNVSEGAREAKHSLCFSLVLLPFWRWEQAGHSQQRQETSLGLLASLSWDLSRWEVLPEPWCPKAPLSAGLENGAREKGKVLIWTTYGFCWSLATDLRSQSGFLGPSYPIPKPTRKPFQIHFISSAIVIALSKIPCPQVSWGAGHPLLKSQACQAFLPWHFPAAAAAGSHLCLVWSSLGALAQLHSPELTSAQELGSPAWPCVPSSPQPTWPGELLDLGAFGTAWRSGSFGNWPCRPLLCCVSSVWEVTRS